MPTIRKPGYRVPDQISGGVGYLPPGYDPGAGYPPYIVGGEPWVPPTVQPPGQVGPNQGMGNWGSDPFGYTNGSLLTPWTQPFVAPNRGGVAAPDLKPWSYADFSYNFQPGRYDARAVETPDAFTYMNYEAPAAFKAPTAAEIETDPGYLATLTSGTRALERSAARAGTLRGTGTLKGLMEYGKRVGADTYRDIYGRRASEYDRAAGMARDVYTMNRGNAAENYDRNITNRLRVGEGNEERRRAGYLANLEGGRVGFDIATGTYDRNQANARAAYESQQEMARAAAAAANAGSAQEYNRAMAEYQMAHDLFRENQGIQWDRLMAMTSLGYGAAANQANAAGNYGGTLGGLYTGGANARAAGIIGRANAWNDALGSFGNTAMDLYLMGSRPNIGTPMPAPAVPRTQPSWRY